MHKVKNSKYIFFFISQYAYKYFCDINGNVICQMGWQMAEIESQRNELYPCSEPVCNFDGKGCLYGTCKHPNYCSCDIGWTGINCGMCIPLPGCRHGYCQNALECICETGWKGALCDIRKFQN